MKIRAGELTAVLALAEALGALRALGQKDIANSLSPHIDAIIEQAWADEAEAQHDSS
jgi:hypothetical protein